MILRVSALALFLGTSCAETSNSLIDDTNAQHSNWGNGGEGPTYSPDSDGGPSASAAELLYRKIQPQLESKCGGACHGTGVTLNAPKWLAGPDSYVSIKAYPGMVTDDVYASKLINRPSGHPAATLVDPGNEAVLADATKWLEAEALVIISTPLPSSPAVNTSAGSVDLSSIGPMLVGAKLTFTSTLVSGAMKFNDIRVLAPPAADLRIVAPILIMVPGDGTQPVLDPALSAVDVTIPAGKTKLLPSPFFFFGWKIGSKIKISFKKIEAVPSAL